MAQLSVIVVSGVDGHLLTAVDIHLILDTDQGAVVATPVLIDAIGRQLENDDIRVIIDRQGIPKL